MSFPQEKRQGSGPHRLLCQWLVLLWAQGSPRKSDGSFEETLQHQTPAQCGRSLWAAKCVLTRTRKRQGWGNHTWSKSQKQGLVMWWRTMWKFKHQEQQEKDLWGQRKMTHCWTKKDRHSASHKWECHFIRWNFWNQTLQMHGCFEPHVLGVAPRSALFIESQSN